MGVRQLLVIRNNYLKNFIALAFFSSEYESGLGWHILGVYPH